jgi:biopolymer transport protein ExbD
MDEREFSQLNVIPLVDIMLVLLTIVLTTSTFIAKGLIPVDLPKARQAGEENLRTLTVDLDRSGGTHLDGQALDLRSLALRLEPLTRSTPVLIRGDREARLQSFVDVLDLVKGMGFRRVSLQTLKAHGGGG